MAKLPTVSGLVWGDRVQVLNVHWILFACKKSFCPWEESLGFARKWYLTWNLPLEKTWQACAGRPGMDFCWLPERASGNGWETKCIPKKNRVKWLLAKDMEMGCLLTFLFQGDWYWKFRYAWRSVLTRMKTAQYLHWENNSSGCDSLWVLLRCQVEITKVKTALQGEIQGDKWDTDSIHINYIYVQMYVCSIYDIMYMVYVRICR